MHVYLRMLLLLSISRTFTAGIFKRTSIILLVSDLLSVCLWIYSPVTEPSVLSTRDTR